jgi:hypothetical protein
MGRIKAGSKITVLLISFLFFLFVLLYLIGIPSPHSTSIHIVPKSQVLDPVLNLSSNSNLINGLSVTSFYNGSALSMTPVNNSLEALYSYIQIPKYAVISPSYFNLTSQNFSGNIAYTPSVSGVTDTAECTSPNSDFTGTVYLNGVPESVTNKSYVGGLYSATGSGTASVSTSNSCSSPGTPYPSSSEDTGTTYTSPSCGCSGGYSGSNPVSAISKQTSQYYDSTTSSFTCNSGTNTGTNCGTPSCSYESLGYTEQVGYSLSSSGVNDSGTGSMVCGNDNSLSLPSPGPVSTISANSNTQSGDANPGSTLSCPSDYGGLNTCSAYNAVSGTEDASGISEGSYTIPGSTTYVPMNALYAVCSKTGSFTVGEFEFYEADGVANCGSYGVNEIYVGQSAYNMLESLDSGHSWDNPITAECTTSGGCSTSSLYGYTLVAYTTDNFQWARTIDSGTYYGTGLVTSPALVLSYASSTFTYYGEDISNGASDLYYSSSPPEYFKYPSSNIYYNDYYTGSSSTGSASPGQTVSVPSNSVGICYTQNIISNEPTTCYENYQYCSPSSVTYTCSGTYNGTGSNLNYCLSSTSGKIVYSASIPSPGSGTISSVTAIPNSCIDSVNNTAVANLSVVSSGDTLFSTTATFTGTKQLNITSALKSFLSSSSQSNGYSYLPIKFTSDKPGLIKLVNLDIPFSYNVSALYSVKYDLFNYTQQGLPIAANSTVGYGANLSVTNTPYETIAVHGFNSKINCQLMIGDNVYNAKVNSSGICPLQVNLTTSGKWQSFSNGSTSSISLFNKKVRPVVQTFGTARQNKSRISIPGVVQYISVPVKVISNASLYGVTSALNVSILHQNVSDFSFDQSQKYYSISNGTTNLNLSYSGDMVTSKQVDVEGNYVSWANNTIQIEDTWNNTSPYNFSLYKSYDLGLGAKVLSCKVNGTQELNTSVCTVVSNSTGVYVEVNYTLNAHKWVDPTIIGEEPSITLTESGASQTSSQITCVVPLGSNSCSSSASSLAPSFSQSAFFKNTGGFEYPKINLSAQVPALNQITAKSILVSYNGVVETPYYINTTSGVINWTTQDFAANSTEHWIITFKGVPLRVEFTNESSLGRFEWDVVATAPPGLAYTNFYLTMDSPIVTSLYACTSTSLSVCTSANLQSYLGQGLNINVVPDVSSADIEVITSQIPANGSIGYVPVGIIGKPISCSVENSTQTPVIVGQVVQVKDRILCSNPNTNSTQSGTLPFLYQFKLPSNAFGIVANATTLNLQNKQPLVSTGLDFASNYTYVPLASSYNASANKTFIVEYKVQPLAVTYSPVTPQVFYTNLPALSYVNVSLSNDAPIPILNASYSIPIQYGFNATFVVNDTLVSNQSKVVGSYPITFTNVPGDKTIYGLIYYFTPTANVTSYKGYATRPNATALSYYLPYAVTSTSPLPMQDLRFMVQVTNNGTGVCDTIQNAYLVSSPAAQNGTPLNFKCLPNYNNSLLEVDLGKLDIGATDYVVLQANASYGTSYLISPPSPIGSGIVQNLIDVGHAIYNGIKYLNSVVDSFFKDVAHFFGGL